MKTLALRFSDKFAPDEGTIEAHEKVIQRLGYVWYGKFGNSPSKKILTEIFEAPQADVLLIDSGASGRYWAKIETYSIEMPALDEMPSYYTNIVDRMKCWFKVVKIEKADKNVMSQCTVISSKRPLSEASKGSMSPFFVIEYDEKRKV